MKTEKEIREQIQLRLNKYNAREFTYIEIVYELQEFCKELQTEALSQNDLSGRSELLVNFLTWYVHNSDYGKIHEPIKAIVDDFIKLTNSH